MTLPPWEILRALGMRYFAERFLRRTGSLGSDDAVVGLLPTGPPGSSIAVPGDDLLLDARRVPLFQKAHATEGKPLWTAETTKGAVVAAAIGSGGLRLGFDPWVAMGAGLVGLADKIPEELRPRRDPQAIPFVDLLASRLAQALVERGVPLETGSRWPGGARFALCLTHDVDRSRKTFQYVTYLGRRRGVPVAGQSPARRGRPYWGFDAIRDIEGSREVRSSFYFLHEGDAYRRGSLRNRVLAWGQADFEDPRVAAVVRALAKDGWEVGLHASLASVDRPDLVLAEKTSLEAIAGAPIAGVRQHYLRLPLPARWEQFQAAGFGYDSSFGYADRCGFRGGTSFPYRLWSEAGPLPLLEVPLHIMDESLSRTADPLSECLRMMDAVEAAGGALTILFHQRYFDEANYPGYAPLYVRVIEEARRRGAWIGPAGEAARSWSR